MHHTCLLQQAQPACTAYVPTFNPAAQLCFLTFCLFCSLRPLFVALNDEAGVVRALAIRVVGRLAGRNPAYVMPALRQHLMQLLSNMDHLPDSGQREGEFSLKWCNWRYRVHAKFACIGIGSV